MEGAKLANDRLGGDLSIWTPLSPRRPLSVCPLVNTWIAASPRSQADDLSGKTVSLSGGGRLRDRSCSADARTEELMDARDVRDGALSVPWDSSMLSSPSSSAPRTASSFAPCVNILSPNEMTFRSLFR